MTKRDQSYRDQPMLFGDASDCVPSSVTVVARSADVDRLSRATDRATSREAAERLVASGSLEGDSAAALELVRENPGRTAYELEAIDKMPSGGGYGRPDRIRKRLAGLADCVPALIRRGESRVCHERGSKCMTWWPVGNTEEKPPWE